MRWTRAAGAVVALTLVPGCAAWIGSRLPVLGGYAPAGRPVPSYYCYDCHGYRYLDPYYDWCAGYGFRYAWNRHPDAVRAYRERYVRIKEQNPSYGRYRYPSAYREQRRYVEPRDYDTWRAGEGLDRSRSPGEVKVREKDRHQPGRTGMKPKRVKDGKVRPVEEPREPRPSGGKRPASWGGG